MLVLSRNQNEDIIITPVDENGKELAPVCVRIVSVDGSKVKVGIDAPRKYQVNRREIQERIDAGKKLPPKIAAME